eukprot:7381485-Prymnesium_polylepis.1
MVTRTAFPSAWCGFTASARAIRSARPRPRAIAIIGGRQDEGGHPAESHLSAAQEVPGKVKFPEMKVKSPRLTY